MKVTRIGESENFEEDLSGWGLQREGGWERSESENQEVVKHASAHYTPPHTELREALHAEV